MGDKLLLKLNIYGKPIANKYYEGKMKRTLKRGLKDLKSLSRKLMEGNHLYTMCGRICRSPGVQILNWSASRPITVDCLFFVCKRQDGFLHLEYNRKMPGVRFELAVKTDAEIEDPVGDSAKMTSSDPS